MQWSLFLLLLMGSCPFFACQNYEYHYIDQNMTWDEAQRFCRENYTDLAMVYDTTDMERLRNSKGTQGPSINQEEAWIGLYSEPGIENMTWHWSLPGTEYDGIKCGTEQPDKGYQFCQVIKNNNEWKNVTSNNTCRFICYKGSNQPDTYYFSRETKTWPEAQKYCRENFKDLVSGFSLFNDSSLTGGINSILQNLFPNQCCFIGLFRDNWKWSSGSSFSFRYWDTNYVYNDPNAQKCAVTALKEDGRWKKSDCSEKKPFFCYDDKMILIKEKKTWKEALDYCRENHMDLVSITNHHQQNMVQKRAQNASTSFVWLGLLYRCPLDMWFWVSDQVVCYDNWNSYAKNDNCGYAGAMDRDGGNKWYSEPENNMYNFICAAKF
ncbi:C-type mannose receptor 2-like [Melanotaenia boesemani]|uniref:C-type mannose receptor 2-like n=1 Tax=Melanotaenia boesemani TaxID=1250792 RepID=UPI001C03EC5C|nr:C-type mannose receptor 2-like [Melanotaenia boesemani]